MKKLWRVAVIVAVLTASSWALTDDLDLIIKYQWITAKQSISKYDNTSVYHLWEHSMHYESYRSAAVEADYFLTKKNSDLRFALILGIDYVPPAQFGTKGEESLGYMDNYYGFKGYWKEFFFGIANQVTYATMGNSSEYKLNNVHSDYDVTYYGVLTRRNPSAKTFIGYTLDNIEFELSVQNVIYEGYVKVKQDGTVPGTYVYSEIGDIQFHFPETKFSVGWKI